MALGSSHAAVASGAVMAAYRRRFGIEDFHSHIRWEAIRDYVDTDSQLTVEVGCNIGVMTIEVAKAISGTLVASEFDDELLSVARSVAEKAGVDNIELSQADLRELGEQPRFQQALLIDVLEHIDDDDVALRQLSDALVAGGTAIVSVPTPRYPDVFGRAFHEAIGHVRDGYLLPELQEKLLAAGLVVQEHRYYTGPRASRVCSWFYKSKVPRRLLLPVMPLLLAWARAGESHSTERNAASLALIAVKPSK